MNKQTLALTGVALALAILYIAYFTDWLKHQDIQIKCRISPASGKVVFYLNKSYSFTSVEVVTTEDAKTNKYPHALWHMVAENTAPPTKTFNYGSPIDGMKPEVATAVPEALQPQVDYSLLVVSANGLKGEQSFSIH